MFRKIIRILGIISVDAVEFIISHFMRINYFIVNAFETASLHIRGLDSNKCTGDKSVYYHLLLYAESQSYSAFKDNRFGWGYGAEFIEWNNLCPATRDKRVRDLICR